MTTDNAFNDKSTTDKAVTDKKATDRPVFRKPIPETPVVDKNATDKPVTDKAAADKPPADKKVINDQTEQRSPVATGTREQPPNGAHARRVFEKQDAEKFRAQWRDVQAGFVDEPKSAVRDADSLVEKMMEVLTAHIAEQRRALEGGWDRDKDMDTEQLRIAFQRYRSLFDQILSV